MAKAPAQGSSKNKAAADRVRIAAIGAGEPIITLDNYNVDLGNAFTYYNTYEDDKVRRKWVQKYLGKDKVALGKLSDVTDHELKQVSVLIRLADRGQPLKPEHMAQINEKLNAVLGSVKSSADVIEVKPGKPVISVAQRIEAIASGYIGELEHELDQFVINKKSDFNMKDFIASNSINSPTAKIIGKWFGKTLTELNEAVRVSQLKKISSDDDEQMSEAYSHFSKPQLKKFAEFVSSIVSDCEQQKVKVVRKARKVKVKPASEVVKRLKWLPEFSGEGLTLKSEHPVKLVNSSEAWLYNTKTRRMTVLKAVDNDILVVKGGSIVNFDTTKSETRTLRKPEDFFKTKLTKRELASAWKSLKTKAVVAKGRMGEDVVIVAVFI